ncbi:MAG: UbiX family flavin prenyltransferase [Nitrospinota bacterium]
MQNKKRIIIGVTGATGVIYAVRVIEALKEYGAEYDRLLIITDAAYKTLNIEFKEGIDILKSTATTIFNQDDLAAPISSGSFITQGMIVVPCSMHSLSNIALSNSSTLLARAADVTLKEGRKLLLIPRETPFHKGHLKLLTKVADIGATILCPMPAFYHHPKSINDIINQTVGKILDQFEIEHDLYKRWGEKLS